MWHRTVELKPLSQQRQPSTLHCQHQSPEKTNDLFIQTITRHRRLESFVPPFWLRLTCAFFVPGNHYVHSGLFEKFTTGLVSLLQMFILKPCSTSFVFLLFSLEILERLTVEFTCHSHNDTDAQLTLFFLENSFVTWTPPRNWKARNSSKPHVHPQLLLWSLLDSNSCDFPQSWMYLGHTC